MKLNSENTNINLRHLRAIHAIWRQGSFVSAAEALGIVPSALTECVRQLEETVGQPLFDRRMRPPQPTPLGLEFLHETAPLVEEFDRALTRLTQNARLERGFLAIGAAPSAISGIVAPALAKFRERHPEVVVTLRDDVAERLAGLVAGGELDLAIAGRAGSSADLVQSEIGRDPFGLACRSDHPLARPGRTVRLADIEAQTLIHLDENTGTARLLAAHAALPEAMRRGRLKAQSTIAQLCLIRAGLGVAFLPQQAVKLFNDASLAFVTIEDLHLTRRLYILQPARRPASHIARTFLGYLEGAAPAGH